MPREIIIPAKNTFELGGYEDVPLGAHEIRGATVCTLVSQGTELSWANGEDFPIHPGYAAIFRVDETGDAVEGIAKGSLRFCMGAHRETQQHDAQYTLPVPEGLSAERAVLARLMGVSMTTMMTTRARPGDKVVIAGAGPVGLLAAQNFRIGGYDVALVEPDAGRRAQGETTGIENVFEAMPLEDTRFAGKTALVVDCSGHEGAVLDACNMVRHGGEVVLVGVPWRKLTEISGHEILHAVFFNFVHLRSGWEWELPIRSRAFVWEELLEGYNNVSHDVIGGFERALDWLRKGLVQVEGLVTTRSPADPATLYREIAGRSVKEPFIVLDWMGGL